MLELDATELARIQFALNMSFHILFPAVSIGLAWAVAVLPHPIHARPQRGVGVRVLLLGQGLRADVRARRRVGRHDELSVRHELAGLHRARRQHHGAVARLRGADGVFHRGDVSRHHAVRQGPRVERLHLSAAALVAIGTTLSAFWILSLNSWMQTPQGHEIVDGKFYAVDWLAIIFNPSFPTGSRTCWSPRC